MAINSRQILSDDLKKPFSFSVILHGALLAVMLINVVTNSTMAPLTISEQSKQPQLQQTPVIEAMTVDASKVQQEVAKLKAAAAAKQQREQAYQNKLAQQAEALKQKQLQAKKSLDNLQKTIAEKAKMAKEKELAKQKEMQELEVTQKKEADRLAEIKKQNDTLAKQNEAAEQALKAKQEKMKAVDLALKKQIDADQNYKPDPSVLNRYKHLILQAISDKWIIPSQVNHDAFSQLNIKLSPTGKVLSVTLLTSSGDPMLDRSALAAVYKASPLPIPTDEKLNALFTNLNLTVRPENMVQTG